MAWTKILLAGDLATELKGTAYRMLLIDSTGAVIELVHGASGYVLKSGGASADPAWAAESAGAHALDAGQTDVTITTPADDEVLSYEVGTWINKTAAEAGLEELVHKDAASGYMGLDAASRGVSVPKLHAADHKLAGGDAILLNELGLPTAAVNLNKQQADGLVLEAVDTPPDLGTEVEGQVYFDTGIADKHAYVWVGA